MRVQAQKTQAAPALGASAKKTIFEAFKARDQNQLFTSVGSIDDRGRHGRTAEARQFFKAFDNPSVLKRDYQTLLLELGMEHEVNAYVEKKSGRILVMTSDMVGAELFLGPTLAELRAPKPPTGRKLEALLKDAWRNERIPEASAEVRRRPEFKDLQTALRAGQPPAGFSTVLLDRGMEHEVWAYVSARSGNIYVEASNMAGATWHAARLVDLMPC